MNTLKAVFHAPDFWRIMLWLFVILGVLSLVSNSLWYSISEFLLATVCGYVWSKLLEKDNEKHD